MEWAGEETKIRWKLNGESVTDENGEAKWQFVPSEDGDWVIEAVVQDRSETLSALRQVSG